MFWRVIGVHGWPKANGKNELNAATSFEKVSGTDVVEWMTILRPLMPSRMVYSEIQERFFETRKLYV